MSSFASQNTASFGYPVPDPAAVSRPGRLEFYDPSPNMTGMPPPPSLAALGRQLTFDGDDEDEAELFLFDTRPPPPGSDMFLDGRGMLSHFSSLEETTRFSLPTPGTPSTLRRFRRSASQHLHEEDSDFMMSDAPPPACLRAGLLHPLRPTNFDLRYGAQGGLSAPQTINSAVSSPLCTQNPSQETTTTSSSFDQLGPAAFSYEPTFEVAYFTHRGPRSSQEDRVFFSYVGNHPKTYFACVYDGHNGADAAEFAMNHLHNVVSNEVTYSTDLSVALVDGIRRTDIMLRESNMDNGSGSTVLVACVRGNVLTIANLGDCRAVMGFKDGTAVPLTVDHRAGQETEQQRVQRHRDAARLEGFSVTRGLADFHVKPPEGVLSGNCALSNVADITTCTLDPSCEFVLLASDGLWDRVSNEYAVAYLHAEFAKQGARSRRLSLDSDDDGAGVDPCSPCDTPRAGACNAVRGLVHSVVDQASDNMTAVCLRFV